MAAACFNDPTPSPAAREIPDWLRRSGIVRRASADPLIGSEVAGARLDHVIAEGGFGVVYAATNIADQSALAIKVLRASHAGDVGISSRFDREIVFARRVRHENVCEVTASGRLADGRPYLVMPRYDGMTLGALMRRGGALSIERALGIADQVLAGLEALHAARVVHRDLQPDNVFLATGDLVKILDLGFASEPGVDDGDGVTPDSPGSLVGTLTFMSPEQAMRARAITERSDLFAAALLTYYALSGKLPFRGRNELEVVVAIVRAAPIPLRRGRRDIPAGLDAVIARALAKHPDARFGSASEMRQALAPFG